MCPLRIILVFLSATLAGYFAWKTVRSSSKADDMIFGDLTTKVEKISSEDNQEFYLKRVIRDGFWVFIDMASGRYLWRNLRVMNEGEKEKSC
ncbi:hypothetical protein HHK36_017512 [Tetracentron sinense]|uniref:Uncharacterized protein n=1 Tax=Tetracentron sinense TaxID=13715 RepID=A0A835DCW9_TETSI|nr:hypothetical protein HHK36_017512 [Tetracentron sinense]